MTRKRPGQVAQVLGALHSRASLAGWDLVHLDGLSQRAVADALATCRLFLSFSTREGFGLPAAEALARGCHVIGYTGIGGREFFGGTAAMAIPEDDVTAYIEAVAAWLARDPWTEAVGQSNSQAVLGRYTQARERDAITTFFSEAVGRAGSLSQASGMISSRQVAVPYRNFPRRAAHGAGSMARGLVRRAHLRPTRLFR